MQKMTQNKQYDHAYKVQAIKLAREIGSAKAAAELGVPKNTKMCIRDSIRSWHTE